MCQFLSLPLFKIPEISKFDVIMRLDSDSFIHGAARARDGRARDGRARSFH